MERRESFKVVVAKDYLKFSAAHFIAYPGFREPLHGHNYRVSVEVAGELGPQGYVVDFGIVKKLARAVCAELDEKVLVPARSDCLAVREEGDCISLRSESGEFRFPRRDCVLLPIVHSSAEELARYLAGELLAALGREGVTKVASIEVGVEETPGQTAYFRLDSSS
ncbi:MAG: 6-pyruvoyl tetrahydrobiopterin synthase [Candidatus Binatia bacterium]|nr:MAG: 6-pyruvoyl tetrahydrobiopterin synthase [Candidatus Binatia bacterium]